MLHCPPLLSVSPRIKTCGSALIKIMHTHLLDESFSYISAIRCNINNAIRMRMQCLKKSCAGNAKICCFAVGCNQLINQPLQKRKCWLMNIWWMILRQELPSLGFYVFQLFLVNGTQFLDQAIMRWSNCSAQTPPGQPRDQRKNMCDE